VIIRTASIVFLIDFVVEIGRALNNSLAGALQAAGDVTYQLIVNQASAWIVSVGGAYLFGIALGWGLYGVWVGFALDEMTRGLILLHRWRSQKWIAVAEKRRNVIAK
jgi:Na+-driven multidrug efflux pump